MELKNAVKYSCIFKNTTKKRNNSYHGKFFVARVIGVLRQHWTSLIHLRLDIMAAILADDIFKCIFVNEGDKIPLQISLKLFLGV